jgi:hypothetical protein
MAIAWIVEHLVCLVGLRVAIEAACFGRGYGRQINILLGICSPGNARTAFSSLLGKKLNLVVKPCGFSVFPGEDWVRGSD